MSIELDPNDIAAKVVVQLTAQAANSFTHAISEHIRAARAKLQVGFKNYISVMLSSFGRVKTLVNPDEPVSVEKIYVSVRLRGERAELSDLNLLSDLSSIRKIIITGHAGTGKSMFLRYALVHALRNYNYILPVYLELRYFKSGESLFKKAFESLNKYVPDINEEAFREGLGNNRFAIFLDGFDELASNIRKGFIDELRELCHSIPRIIVVITSRPADSILYLPNFHNYKVEPFSIPQVMRLIENIPPDKEKYEEFIRRMQQGLYLQHKEFLSNPLLALMMFVTFCKISEISSRMHIFYNDAFHVLAQWHDRSKGAFTREFKSGLDIASFRDVFSAFCAYSYFDLQYVFSESTLQEYASDAAKYYLKQESVADIIQDMTESTSLVQRDGLNYIFVHRSFQEYFTAVFLKELDDENLAKCVDGLIDRGQTDNVVSMLRDMQRNRFDIVWLLPYVERILKNFPKSNFPVENYLEEFPREISIQGGRVSFHYSSPEPEALKLASVLRLFSFRPNADIHDHASKEAWGKIRDEIRAASPSSKFTSQVQAAFGVDWEFQVRTGEIAALPPSALFDPRGLPLEFLKVLRVERLVREEANFLRGLVKNLGLVATRKQAGLQEMLRDRN